jgi:REP element-mobilizing transposase RayT
MERYQLAEDVGIYFVTMSVVDWLPVFVSERSCQVLTESLNFCHERKGLRVNAYVIMPTHFHAIVFLQRSDPTVLKGTLTDFRKFTGRRLIEFCRTHSPGCFNDVFVAKSGEDRERRFWQPTLHPERIESEAFYVQKLSYIHDNPCRKGLVTRAEHWRFSAASYWLSGGAAAAEVTLSPLEW